jgi:hypothetical protein
MKEKKIVKADNLSLGDALRDESAADAIASLRLSAESEWMSESKLTHEKPPLAAIQMPTPPEPAPPPRATIDNTPDIDLLSQEVSPNSGLYRKYRAGPAKPTP